MEVFLVKKALLLTLSILCGLPALSLHAGWHERLQALSFVWAADELNGVPAIPATSSSENYKELATPVMQAISKLKGEQKRQAHIDSAKQNTLCTAARAGILATSMCLKPLLAKYKWNSSPHIGGIQQKVEAYLPKPLTINSVLFLITCVKIANHAESAFSDWMQAQRYEKRNKEELQQHYDKAFAALAAAHRSNPFGPDEQAHMGHLIV